MGSCGSHCCCVAKETDDVVAVKEALNTWLNAISIGAPDAVMTLYADDAVVLLAFAPGVHANPAKRLEYFKMFTANENLQCKIDELHTRVFGDIGINSGLYTFTFKKNGQDVSMAARFSFVYKKTALGWLIVDQHSSLVPAGH
ncbi:MAG: DUF4440 domain-containing protein [Proteobacteria bacterium]|jgi:uncharacterized protein (TIGR02246 family)|nr:nuclear transport factor 2 family protein [Alphaproteobacteria bacterium]NCC03185.1 DUF4440 domain-containing protein [Pseudomonadota bacterium]